MEVQKVKNITLSDDSLYTGDVLVVSGEYIPEGWGKKVIPNIESFTGIFKDGKPNGLSYYNRHTNMFLGYFKKETKTMDGWGLTMDNGELKFGVWRNSKAIKDCSNRDPYLFVYRFSLTYEYNKAFYSLFAHSEGKEINYSPFDIMGQSAMMAYEHHLQGMQMTDMFTEPRVGQLDNALNNIFHQIWSRYSQANPEDIKQLGNQYHSQIFNYVQKKIMNEDLYF